MKIRIPRWYDEPGEIEELYEIHEVMGMNEDNRSIEEMEYTKGEFGHRECTEKCVMILSLNKKKQTERIIIGECLQVECWLAGCGGGDFYFDVTRPLGTFLHEHELCRNAEWNRCADALLMEAMRNGEGCWDLENEAWAFLQAKMQEPELVTKFTAYQCWSWFRQYLEKKDSEKKAGQYGNDVLGLVRSFPLEIWKDAPSPENAWKTVRRGAEETRFTRDLHLDIRYTGWNRSEEWVVVRCSYYPVLQYYLKTLMELGLCYCSCQICDSRFLAKSKRFTVCSKACHDARNRRNKRKFDAQAKENRYDIVYKNSYQRMRNQINKQKAQAGISEEQVLELENHFAAFRKEALRRKKLIKSQSENQDFYDWLYEQERVLDALCAD